MRKLGTVLMIFLFFVMKLFGQATISDIKLTPDLDITWFEAYTLSAKVVPDAGVSIQTVTFSVRPQSVSDAILNWDYLTDGTAIPMPNVPLEYVGTITDTNVYTFDRLRPDDIYPEIRYIPEITSPPDDSRFHRSNYHLMKFTNPFPMGVNTSFFIELYASPAAHPSVPNLEVYLVGKGFDISEFQTGAFTNQAWMNHPNVESVGNISQETPYHHTHTANSMHFLIPLSTNADGKLGNKGIDISEDFWIILYNNAPQSTRGWDLKYHAGNNNSTWYKGGGTNFTVQSGLPDVHVHFARRESTTIADWMDVKVEVDYTGGDIAGPISLSNTFSFGDLPNLAPNVSSFTAPAPGTYSDNVTISWNPALDPNITNTLTYYLELVDYSTKSPIYTDLPGQTQTSTIFNTLLVPNGDYDILVKACDDGTPSLCTPFYWSSTQEMENARITVSNTGSTVTWVGGTSSDWGLAANWTESNAPIGSSLVVIPGGITNYYPKITNAAGVSGLNIGSGASLTIESSGSLRVGGSITNEGGVNGLVIESTADGTGSLIHNTNDVPATIKRHISGSSTLTAKQYHMVSVPLTQASNPKSGLFTGSYLYRFNVATQDWVHMQSSPDNPLFVNQGYMIYYPDESNTYTFAGPLNNGSFSIPVSYASTDDYSGFNLVPNPYPSAIDWTASGTAWTKKELEDAIWIWNTDASIPYETGKVGNYAAYVEGVGTNGGTNFIPTGQSFFVQTKNAGAELTVTNAARVHSDQAFFKSAATQDEPPSLLRVKVAANNYRDEIVVRFHPEATAGHDSHYDAVKMFGSAEAPQLYSIADDQQKLSINSLPYVGEEISIPVGFELDTAGAVSFAFEGIAGFDTSLDILLKDLHTGKLVNLRESDVFSFVHEEGADPLRFVLSIGHAQTTGISSGQLLPDHQIFATSGQVHVHIPSLDGQPASIAMFDLLGRQVVSAELVLGAGTTFDAGAFNGIAIVRVTCGQDVFTQRVFLK